MGRCEKTLKAEREIQLKALLTTAEESDGENGKMRGKRGRVGGAKRTSG